MKRLTEKYYEQILIKDLDIVGIGEHNANILDAATIKLFEYENSLLEPKEVKELILDICKGNYQKWNQKLSQLLHENY